MPGPSPLRLLPRCFGRGNRNLRRSSTGARAATPPFPEMRRRTQRDAAPPWRMLQRVISRFAPPAVPSDSRSERRNRRVKARIQFDAFPLKRFPTSVWRLHRDNLEIVLSKLQYKFPALQRPSSSGTWTSDAPGVRQLSFRLSRMSCCLSASGQANPPSSRYVVTLDHRPAAFQLMGCYARNTASAGSLPAISGRRQGDSGK